MNCDTGHLVTEAMLKEMGIEQREKYEMVPDGALSRRAQKLLDANPGGVTVPQSDPLTRAMKRVRAARKKAEKKARKRARR
jgi:hypothetical protein